MKITEVYRPSLSLLTDLYQLTMAQGYWRQGLAERRACFHLFFRRNPFRGGYAITAGLADAIAYLDDVKFSDDDVAYLAELKNSDGSPLFDPPFLSHLATLEWSLDIDAMPEGTLAFPHEPLVRVTGPLLQAQIVETPLLNIINFQTLIATKAARICRAARSENGEQESVLEFGLRRAQGIDGGLAATRASFVGGCSATSHVLAGKLFGIPVRGTHAHAWVTAFDTELQAFRAYAESMPKNCVFLVDTYDTLKGVENAVTVGRELREQGHEMVGVRLDSGDLAALSIGARRILDEGGFPNAKIVASNDLDEHKITELKARGAKITVWGIGTRLVTAHDQPALGGVYKLACVQDAEGTWQPRVKLSEQAIKVSVPGVQQVRRFRRDDKLVGDMIYDTRTGPSSDAVHPEDPSVTRSLEGTHEDLLQPMMRAGEVIGALPTLPEIRARALQALQELPEETARNNEPVPYFAGVERGLSALRDRLRTVKGRA